MRPDANPPYTVRGVHRPLIALAAATALAGVAAPALASFPGREGQITYTRTNGLGNQTVWSVDPATGEERQLTQVPGRCRGLEEGWFDDVPAFSASGRHVYFSHSGDCRQGKPDGLYRVPVGGGPPELVLRDRRQRITWWPVPMAGGRRLLFVNDLPVPRRRDRDGYSNTIFSTTLKGAGRTRKLSPPGATSDEFPGVSVFGRLAFGRDRRFLLSGPSRGRLRQNRRGLRRLATNRRGAVATPDFSPDGRRLLFTRERHRRGFHSDVFVVGVNGGPIRRVTRTDDAVSPVWSPTGRRIAYVRSPDDKDPFQGPLYIAGPRGKNARKLIGGIDVARLSWQRLP